jgi:hypothetical protein
MRSGWPQQDVHTSLVFWAPTGLAIHASTSSGDRRDNSIFRIFDTALPLIFVRNSLVQFAPDGEVPGHFGRTRPGSQEGGCALCAASLLRRQVFAGIAVADLLHSVLLV